VSDPGPDIEYIYNVLTDVKNRMKIDPSKIFACGFSNGGLFTSALSIHCANIFAAICNYMGGISKQEGASKPHQTQDKTRYFIK
jgi:poly(3-hydroxybutyrate) depolymerase